MSESSITIPGVPESIDRKAVCDLIASLGLEPKDVISLAFEPLGIRAEVCALNEQGQRFTADGENVATHRLTIPIVDKEPT